MPEKQEEIKEVKSERIQALWEMYKDESEWQRHGENQRLNVTSILLVIEGAILLFLPKDRPLTIEHLPPILFLFLLGIYGAFFVWNYWERFRLHMQFIREFRDELDTYLATANDTRPIYRIREEAKRKHYPSRLHTQKHGDRIADPGWQYILWISLHFMISAMAVFLAYIAIY